MRFDSLVEKMAAALYNRTNLHIDGGWDGLNHEPTKELFRSEARAVIPVIYTYVNERVWPLLREAACAEDILCRAGYPIEAQRIHLAVERAEE